LVERVVRRDGVVVRRGSSSSSEAVKASWWRVKGEVDGRDGMVMGLEEREEEGVGEEEGDGCESVE
jgi:hypothetical protein